MLAEDNTDTTSELHSDTADDEVNIAMTQDDVYEANAELERILANTTFLHSFGLLAHRKSEMKKEKKELSITERRTEFTTVRIDTGANWSSPIGLQQ